MFALVAADTTGERAQGTHAHAQCRRDDGASRPVLSARPAPVGLPRTSYVLRRLRLRAFSIACRHVARRRLAAPLVPIFRPVARPLHLELIALRHQLAVVHRSRRPRLRFTAADRILWAWLSHVWGGWRSAVHIVKPETVIAWHRRGFRLFWTWKSRHRTGRPALPPDVRALIRDMSTANPLWVPPRIHGELLRWGSR
jgi:hypothetical protein